jgi:hypothetical protein
MAPTGKLGLELPAGSDLITRTTQLNANLSRLMDATGFILCTSDARPVPPTTFPGMPIHETDTGAKYMRNPLDTGWLPVGASTWATLGAGAIRATKPLRPYGQDTNHSAFPAILLKQDGEMICVYRQGTDHITARDGILRVTRSSDMGRSWASPATLLSLPGVDLRDPGLSESADGTKIWLTYVKTTAAAPFNGAYFRTSTDGGLSFGAETRIDNGVTAASVAPIVELNDGTLVMPWYGTTGAETWRSVWIAKSTNGGTSWTSTRIVNGQTAGRHYEEPYIARNGTILGMTFRWGAVQSIGFASSVDNAVNWSAGAEKFAGTGKPNCFWVNPHTLALIYRRLSGGHAIIRYTRDLGQTWFGEIAIENRRSPSGWMTYSDVSMVQPGAGIMALAQETSSASSRLFFGYVGEAGATTPFGALDEEQAALTSNVDGVIFATNFGQADGALTSPWAVTSGTGNVSNGVLTPATAATQTVARIHAGSTEIEVEGEFQWTGADVGFAGLVFAMTDGATYWAFLRDFPASVASLRLYQYTGGVPTMKATVAFPSMPSTYHKLKVIKKHGSVACFWNDRNMLNYSMTGPELTSTVNGTYVGVSLQNGSGGDQATCRRFLVRN